MNTMTLLPRKSDSRTCLPSREGREKLGTDVPNESVCVVAMKNLLPSTPWYVGL